MAEKLPATTKHSGMGAIPHAKGVTFRVWAPHAEKVYLIGTFNGWNETSTRVVGTIGLDDGSRHFSHCSDAALLRPAMRRVEWLVWPDSCI